MTLRKLFQAGCALLTVLIVGLHDEARVAATPAPGPDAFGYRAAPIPANLRDVSATGVFVPVDDDEVSGAIALPFSFTFYGVPYTELFISSNGYMSFQPNNGNSGCCAGPVLPQADKVNNLIAGFWEDLNFPSGNIRHGTVGAAPNRQFVVGFYAVHHCCSQAPVTFEMILHEGTNDIELQYGAAPGDGGTHTVGIENPDGTIGLQIAHGNISFNNQGFLISTHAPTALITSVEAFSCPIRTEMEIADDKGHALSGAVNVYDVFNSYPDGLSAIRLELLHTGCSAPLPMMDFRLNGTAVDSFEETVPQASQPPPGACTCTPGIETRIYDNPNALALWRSANGATNLFELDRPAADEGQVAFSWARLVLSGSGQPDRTYCLSDIDGGTCDDANLCNAGVTWEEFATDNMFAGDTALVASVSYTDSTLPSSVDFSGGMSDAAIIELTTFDGAMSSSSTVTVDAGACGLLTINNTPPDASCQDVTVAAAPGACSVASASVDNGSSDLEGPVSLEQMPAGPYRLGATTVTLTATDSEGLTDSCQAIVTVVDQEAPVIASITATPDVLWPANHRMVPIALTVVSGDNCSASCGITSVTSNEPLNGPGDGNTAADWALTGPLSLNLRAERSGRESGRVYTVGVACTDDAGNSTASSVNVTVPHDRRKK